MRSHLKYLALAFSLATVPAIAKDSVWSVVRLDGDTVSGCTLHALHDSLLDLRCNGVEMSVPIDSIHTLFRSQERGSITVYTVLGGAAMGAFIGGAMYEEPINPSGFFAPDPEAGKTSAAIGGGIVGGLIGYVIGRTISGPGVTIEEYVLYGRSHSYKVRTISFILLTKE